MLDSPGKFIRFVMGVGIAFTFLAGVYSLWVANQNDRQDKFQIVLASSVQNPVEFDLSYKFQDSSNGSELPWLEFNGSKNQTTFSVEPNKEKTIEVSVGVNKRLYDVLFKGVASGTFHGNLTVDSQDDEQAAVVYPFEFYVESFWTTARLPIILAVICVLVFIGLCFWCYQILDRPFGYFEVMRRVENEDDDDAADSLPGYFDLDVEDLETDGESDGSQDDSKEFGVETEPSYGFRKKDPEYEPDPGTPKIYLHDNRSWLPWLLDLMRFNSWWPMSSNYQIKVANRDYDFPSFGLEFIAKGEVRITESKARVFSFREPSELCSANPHEKKGGSIEEGEHLFFETASPKEVPNEEIRHQTYDYVLLFHAGSDVEKMSEESTFDLNVTAEDSGEIDDVAF